MIVSVSDFICLYPDPDPFARPPASNKKGTNGKVGIKPGTVYGIQQKGEVGTFPQLF